jgi:hypothetical protein
MHTKFNKDYFRHSNVNGVLIHRQHYDCISLLLFFKNKESTLKISSPGFIDDRKVKHAQKDWKYL